MLDEGKDKDILSARRIQPMFLSPVYDCSILKTATTPFSLYVVSGILASASRKLT